METVGPKPAELECLFFAAAEPLSLEELSAALETDQAAVRLCIEALRAALAERGSGLRLMEIAGGWQLATRAEHSAVVGRLLARSSPRLTRSALETLAIVAYRQPVTAPEIEALRGVSSGSVLRTLQDRRLIYETGRKTGPGRAAMYGTTPEFLHYFGLPSLGELPAMEQTADLRSEDTGADPPGKDVESQTGKLDI